MDSLFCTPPKTPTIAIIGGGWYGCYIAKYLYEIGGHTDITLFEKNTTLMSGNSGQAFNRIHAGPHYPRCAETRAQIQSNMWQFAKEFPELIVSPVSSFYALGTRDANSRPSLVTPELFKKVCFELPECESMSVSSLETDYHIKLQSSVSDSDHNTQSAQTTQVSNFPFHGNIVYKVNEPVIYTKRPRKHFRELFKKYNIKLKFGFKVTRLAQNEDTKRVYLRAEKSQKPTDDAYDSHVHAWSGMFDFVINCTYYSSFVSNKVTLGASLDKSLGCKDLAPPKVVYEPCLSLLYEPPAEWRNSDKNLWSLTIMDGGFPALMPFCMDVSDDEKQPHDVQTRYVMYHACYSKLAKVETHAEAVQFIEKFCGEAKNYVDGQVGRDKRLKLVDVFEKDFCRYMKDFKKDFKYVGYKMLIRTKLDVAKDFRGNFVWRDADNSGLIQVFSGKITNCVNAGPIVLSIIRDEMSK